MARLLGVAVLVLLLKKRASSPTAGGTPQPQDPPFYRHGFTVLEALALAALLTLMAWISLAKADEELAALGSTLLLVAAFLATPKLLANSYGRRLQAVALNRWRSADPDSITRSQPTQAVLILLITLGVASIVLEGVGAYLTLRGDDTHFELGVYLFATGAFLLVLVLAAAALLLLSVTFVKALAEDAKDLKGEVLQPDASDRVWVAALFVFFSGTLLQFVDAVLRDG